MHKSWLGLGRVVWRSLEVLFYSLFSSILSATRNGVLFPFYRLRCGAVKWFSSPMTSLGWNASLFLPLCQHRHSQFPFLYSDVLGYSDHYYFTSVSWSFFLKNSTIYSVETLYCLGSGQEYEEVNSLGFALGGY